MKKVILGSLALLFMLLIVNCQKNDENEISGSSHNTGRNCLGCHSDFKVAGSVCTKSLANIYAGVYVGVTG
jgi:hypothetical protein